MNSTFPAPFNFHIGMLPAVLEVKFPNWPVTGPALLPFIFSEKLS
jgi:hypothetical protein